MTAGGRKREKQYQVDSAMSTLKRAEEIKRDPSLMRDVQKAATQLANACSVKSRSTPAKKKK